MVVPPRGEVRVTVAQLGDQVAEALVAGVTPDLVPRRADGGRRIVRPVLDPLTRTGVEEQPAHQDGTRVDLGAEDSAEKCVAGQDLGPSSQDQGGNVVQRRHHPQQTGVGSLRCLPRRRAPTRWRSEVAQVDTLDLVELERSAERLDDLVGDRVLSTLLETAVVVGTDAGQEGQLLLAETGDPTGPGERGDPGLGGSESVPAGAEEGSQG